MFTHRAFTYCLEFVYENVLSPYDVVTVFMIKVTCGGIVNNYQYSGPSSSTLLRPLYYTSLLILKLSLCSVVYKCVLQLVQWSIYQWSLSLM